MPFLNYEFTFKKKNKLSYYKLKGILEMVF